MMRVETGRSADSDFVDGVRLIALGEWKIKP